MHLQQLRCGLLFMIVVGMPSMAVSVAKPMAAAQQPDRPDVHRQTEAGDRDGLGEVDRHRREQTDHGLVADQDRDHRQNDGGREAC